MIFEKAIKRNFSADMTYEEVVELLPLIYYSTSDMEAYISSLNLSKSNLTIVVELCELITQLKTTLQFQSLLTDVARELMHRQKTGASYLLGVVSSPYLCNEFDSALTVEKKVKIVLSEITKMIGLSKENKEFFVYQSELFEADIYHSEIVAIICVILNELPLMWSVAEVVAGLLHCRRGFAFIRSVVLNFPHQWEPACRLLVQCATRCCLNARPSSTSAGVEAISELTWPYRKGIRCLLELSPQQTPHILEFCLSEHKLPELTLDLALDLHRVGKLSILEFLKRVLLDEGPESRQWFAGYIKTSQNVTDRIQQLNSRLIEVARSLLPMDSKTPLTEDSLASAQLFLKVVAALRGFTDYDFSPEMSACLVHLVTQRTPISERAVQYISFSLAFFIGLRSSFIKTNSAKESPAMAEVEQRIVEWLQYLLKEQDAFYEKLHNSCAELLLLLAIFFHTNQSGAIAEIISGILGLRVPSLNKNITSLRKIFTQRVFTEQVITNQAARVPVTKNLNKNLMGHLPIHCVLQLLKTRSFAKNKVQIKDWIYHQLCNSVRPLHPLLPDLIDAYARTILEPHERQGLTNDPISETELARIFAPDRAGLAGLCAPAVVMTTGSLALIDQTQPDLTPQLLLLYYLISYYDSRLSSQANINRHKRQVLKYSSGIWSQVPVSYLLRYCRTHVADYRTLYPRLLRLVTNHLPQLVLGEYVMQDEMLQDETWSPEMPPNSDGVAPSPQELDLGFSQLSADGGVRLLPQLTRVLRVRQPESLVRYCEPLVGHLALLLPHRGVRRRVATACRDLWLRLHLVMPRKLQVMTVNALHKPPKPGDFLDAIQFREKPLSEEDIILDPVENILMGLDERIFRCPPILDLVLRVLECSLVASRCYWDHAGAEHPAQVIVKPLAGEDEREVLRKSLLMTQEAAVIQILLERCLPTEEEKARQSEISELREVRSIICTFIHHLFISDPGRCHVVHWQTYPLELLPMTVQGIPSMHICISSIVEVFRSCGDYGKMVFYVNLMSYLAVHYNIQSAMEKATLLLEALYHIMSNTLSVEEKPAVCLPCLDAVVRFAVTFPRLAQLAARFFLTLASQCRTQLAVYHQPIPAHFNQEALGMESEDITAMEAKFETLSLEEKYKLCFVKTMATYDVLINKALVQRIAYYSTE